MPKDATAVVRIVQDIGFKFFASRGDPDDDMAGEGSRLFGEGRHHLEGIRMDIGEIQGFVSRIGFVGVDVGFVVGVTDVVGSVLIVVGGSIIVVGTLLIIVVGGSIIVVGTFGTLVGGTITVVGGLILVVGG